MQMEEHDAEKMKLKYANAFTDNDEIDNTLMLPIDSDRDESENLLSLSRHVFKK